MRIRIIAGKYGGRKIDAPRGRNTHPMGERIRNAVFNKIQSELVDAEVLDIYAGTGSLGIESLSRGAKKAVFVDNSRLAQKIIKNNLELLHIDEDAARLFRCSAKSFLSQNDEKFDIIFTDPPYWDALNQFSTIERIFNLLKPGALMVLSIPGKCEELVVPNEIVVVDVRYYSGATLAFYRKKR